MIIALSACSIESDDEEEVNAIPVITSTAVSSIEAGTSYSYTITATDDDGDSLTFDATTLPSWLSFDAASGTLTGMPTAADEGDHNVTITVDDGTDTVTSTFTISVTVPNSAPVITSTGVTTATEGEEYSYTVMATDADSDTLTMTATTIASWLTFDASSGMLTGTPMASDVGEHEIELTVSDGTDSISQTFSIIVEASATPALIVYEDAANPKWASWDCCGGTVATIEDDGSDYGNVTEFTIGNNGETVVGFTTRAVDGAVGGTMFDASAIEDAGTLEFDLKLVTAPVGTPAWNLKLESNAAESYAEVLLSSAQEGHTSPVVDTWQHYTFNLADLKAAGLDLTKIDVIMIFPAWGTGDGAVFKVDNVKFMTEGSDAVVSEHDSGLISNGEFSSSNGWGGTDGMAASINNGIFSADIAVAGNAWDVSLKQNLALTPDTTYTLTFDARSDDARDIIAGLGLDAAPWDNDVETVSLTTDWETYTLTLTTTGFGDSTSRVFFDLGAAAGQVQLDNVSVTTDSGESGNTGAASDKPSLPLDFESSTFTYVLTDFGGASSSLVADPDSANARGTVAKTIKAGDAQSWAGTTASDTTGLAEAVAFTSSSTVMKVWVYSPEVGLTVRLKLEDASDATVTVETDTLTTVANTWEEMSFDFANEATGTQALNTSSTFNKASIFFNFNVDGATAGEMTFYWDGLSFE